MGLSLQNHFHQNRQFRQEGHCAGLPDSGPSGRGKAASASGCFRVQPHNQLLQPLQLCQQGQVHTMGGIKP